MDAVLLLVMAAAGLCAADQYYFVYDLKTVTEAQQYCRERNGKLATIHSMEDVTALNNMADLSQMVSSSGQAWIGLYGEPGSWRWSLSNTSFYEHVEEEFRPWYPGYPTEKHCIFVYYDGRWWDDSCESAYHAVCMDVRGTNATFVRTQARMTWTEAQSYCREHHTDLASVRDEAENQKIKTMMTTENVWIGLFRDSWNWSDGSSSSFRYWSAGKPSGLSVGCAAADFSNSGKWANHDCSLRKPFICSGPSATKQVIKLRLLEQNSLDLNNPAVMEGILKQVRQRLKDQGVDDNNVKLSWKKQADGKVFHKEKKDTKKKTCPGKDEL